MSPRRVVLLLSFAALATGWWTTHWPGAASHGDQQTAEGQVGSAALVRPEISAHSGPSSNTAESRAPADGTSRVDHQVAAISRDYAEMKADVSSSFNAVVQSNRGLSAYLDRLALLEREQRRDLAAVLSPAELEAFEMRETPAGHIVRELLAGTSATEEQRRRVFRLQAEFENRFGMRFDSSPMDMLTRERANLELQESIRGVLGDAMFALWLAGLSPDISAQADAAQRARSAPETIQAWRRSTELNLRRLEILATVGISPDEARQAYSAFAAHAQGSTH